MYEQRDGDYENDDDDNDDDDDYGQRCKRE